MDSALRISDFEDTSFDPFHEWEKSIGMDDVENPHPAFDRLRQSASVQEGDLKETFGMARAPVWEDMPSYLIFGYREAYLALADAEGFSNKLLERMYAFGFGRANLHAMDAPEHTRYRKLFQKGFLPGFIDSWRDTLVAQVINHFIDGFAAQGKANLIEEFTRLYPFHFIYGQIGLPKEDEETFHKLAVCLLCTINPDKMLEASQKLGHYFSRMLDERRDNPGTDLVSILATAEVEGDRIPNDVAVSFLRQLITAGGGTTFHATGSMMVGLLSNPEQLAAVKQDRSLVPQVVEEALRWETPSTIAMRGTTKDVAIGGKVIPKGSKVEIVLASANHDEARFPDPHRFDIFRKREKSLSFSHGPHICIGQHLARMEMSVALNSLLDRLPNLRLDSDKPPPTIRGLITRTPDALHVSFG